MLLGLSRERLYQVYTARDGAGRWQTARADSAAAGCGPAIAWPDSP